MSSIPNDNTSFYNLQAADLHQKWLREKSISDLLPFIEMLEPGARVLDLGCGTGLDLVWLAKSGFQGVGVDCSSGMVEAAKNIHEHSGIQIQEKNFLLMSLAEGEFGGMWANLSFPEFPPENLQRLLAICFKGMKSGGILGAVLFEGVGSYEEAVICQTALSDRTAMLTRKIYLYSEKAISSLLDQTGFQIVRVGRNKGPNDSVTRLMVIAKRI
jgi:ubiquinone/menaquinone biosynthesis C-methylase UbiE